MCTCVCVCVHVCASFSLCTERHIPGLLITTVTVPGKWFWRLPQLIENGQWFRETSSGEEVGCSVHWDQKNEKELMFIKYFKS